VAANLAQCPKFSPISDFCLDGGAGNPARSRLSDGFLPVANSEGRLKAGWSQDCLPRNALRASSQRSAFSFQLGRSPFRPAWWALGQNRRGAQRFSGLVIQLLQTAHPKRSIRHWAIRAGKIAFPGSAIAESTAALSRVTIEDVLE
jgi:hypothetical protein